MLQPTSKVSCAAPEGAWPSFQPVTLAWVSVPVPPFSVQAKPSLLLLVATAPVPDMTQPEVPGVAPLVMICVGVVPELRSMTGAAAL